MIGERVGPWEIRAALGEGGAASVWRADHRQSGASVAVKILKRRWSEHERVRRRFVREGQVLRNLDHPGIPKFLELRVWQDRPALIMELVRGLTIADLLESNEILHAPRLVPWICEVLSALAHAHARHIVHRDIKPANLLIGVDGVKVLDFGLARVGDESRLTADGTTVGTLHYLPPEQARGEPLDGRADLYALGVTLYHCLTGELPYEARTASELMAAVRRGDLIPPSRRWPLIDPELEAIILRAMAHRPEQRHADAGAMRRALLDWLKRPGQTS